MRVEAAFSASQRRRAWLLVGLGLSLLTAPLPALGVELCSGTASDFKLLDPGDDESGLGGTGLSPTRAHEDESGIGGTGRAPDPGDEDSGIGGTGAGPGSGEDDSGLGGTGLFGTFSRVDGGSPETGSSEAKERGPTGSTGRADRVCLNGVEVTIPETLALESSGDGEGPSSLLQGQIAYVEAARLGVDIVAQRVVIAEPGAGQLEAVSKSGRRLIVSGRRVQLAEDATLAQGLDLAAGTWIAFHGSRAPDGTIRATRVDAGVDGETRSIPREFPDRVATWLREADPRWASIEGFVRDLGERPHVAGLALEFPRPRAAAMRERLQVGARVRVGGRLGAGAVLRVEPPPRWLRPTRPDRFVPERPASEPTRPPSTRPAPDARGGNPGRPGPKAGGGNPGRPGPKAAPHRRPDVVRPQRPSVRDMVPEKSPRDVAPPVLR